MNKFVVMTYRSDVDSALVLARFVFVSACVLSSNVARHVARLEHDDSVDHVAPVRTKPSRVRTTSPATSARFFPVVIARGMS